MSKATFTFTFSKIWGSCNIYQIIHNIKRKRWIIPYEILYWKLLLKANLLRIFTHHKLFLPTKWTNFLVSLWVVFVFEKIKKKTLQYCFFSNENTLFWKSGAIAINSCIWYIELIVWPRYFAVYICDGIFFAKIVNS